MKDLWHKALAVCVTVSVWPWVTPAQVGSEKAVLKQLRDGEEFGNPVTGNRSGR